MNHVQNLSVVMLTLLLIIGFSGEVFASSSTTYEVRNENLGTGGSDTSSSTSYILRDSISGPGLGDSTSTTYNLDAGYRGQIYDRLADYEVFIQNRSSQVAATALSSETVTVTSGTGFDAGDMVIIIQNEGSNQSAAIGEVESRALNDITVDFLSGDSLSIDGSNDYVYELNSNSLAFGNLSTSVVTTGIIAWQATADNDEGYTVYVFEDDDFKEVGGEAIQDVTDGTVSVGSSEYGARSSDSSLASSTFDTEDSAFSTTWTPVGSRSAGEFKTRDFLTLKAAISGAQTSGNYSHTLTFIYVGDY